MCSVTRTQISDGFVLPFGEGEHEAAQLETRRTTATQPNVREVENSLLLRSEISSTSGS